MFSKNRCVLMLGFLILSVACGNAADDTNDDWDEELPEPPKYVVPEGVQTLEFNPGNLTDEDQHSPHLPSDLKCDGCRVVAYVMKERLKKMQKRYKKGHKFLESDVVDLLDRACTDKEEVFNGYGMKEIMGKRRLSGEGLETKDIPGLNEGGGKWPQRLKQLCFQYLGEVGDEAIYETFLQHKSIEDLICRDKLGPICPKRKKKKGKKGKKSKKGSKKDKNQDNAKEEGEADTEKSKDNKMEAEEAAKKNENLLGDDAADDASKAKESKEKKSINKVDTENVNHDDSKDGESKSKQIKSKHEKQSKIKHENKEKDEL